MIKEAPLSFYFKLLLNFFNKHVDIEWPHTFVDLNLGNINPKMCAIVCNTLQACNANKLLRFYF